MWHLIVSVPDHCLSFYFVFICFYFLISIGLYGSRVFVDTSQCQCVQMICGFF